MSEQLSFFNSTPPKAELDVVELIQKSVDPEVLPFLSIRLNLSQARTNTPTNSIVVSAPPSDFRPTPLAEGLICNIKSSGKLHYVRFRSCYYAPLTSLGLPCVMESTQPFFRVDLSTFTTALQNASRFRSFFDQILVDSLALEQFSCCNCFQECSHAGKCVQSDLVWGMGCYYRKNLQAWKVFY